MTPNSVQSNTILVKVVGVLYLQGKLAKIQKSTEEEPMYFRVIIHLLQIFHVRSERQIIFYSNVQGNGPLLNETICLLPRNS